MSEDRATYLGLVSLAEQFRIKAHLPLALQCLNAAANLTNIRIDDKSSHISRINNMIRKFDSLEWKKTKARVSKFETFESRLENLM